MSELKRNKTSFTGVYGSENMNNLAKIKDEKWVSYREMYDKASKLELVPNFPIQIDFELNATCNLRCPMCPLSVESNNEKNIFKFLMIYFVKLSMKV